MMLLERTELLFERGTLTKAGRPKQRTREVLAGLSYPERRSLYARLERRFLSAVRDSRKGAPAKNQRRAQSLNRRFGFGFGLPRPSSFMPRGLPTPRVHGMQRVKPPMTFRGVTGPVRSR